MGVIVILILGAVIITIAFGCSKDHSAPTNIIYKALSSPDNVEAVYNSENDVVNVSWTMSDTSGVSGFNIAVSDSNVFDYGEIRNFNVHIAKLVIPYSFTYNAFTYYKPADVDSLILYFTVSAIFKNETFSDFIGPRAVKAGLTYGDSALVLRK